MIEKKANKLTALETPQNTLMNLRVNGTLTIPSFQKNSISSTISRIKDISSMRYSLKKIDDYSYTVKRTR